jgi:hydrogenase maturation protease
MTAPRILVAGIGNVFLGDDAFGVEVAERLARRGLPAGVEVMDAGIRGFDLAHALVDGYDAAILVDVTRRGGVPGTLYALDIEDAAVAPPVIEPHAMDPGKVLALARALGTAPARLYLVGCEPLAFGNGDDIAPGLSAPVAAAVEAAMALVGSLVADIREAAARHA